MNTSKIFGWVLFANEEFKLLVEKFRDGTLKEGDFEQLGNHFSDLLTTVAAEKKNLTSNGNVEIWTFVPDNR